MHFVLTFRLARTMILINMRNLGGKFGILVQSSIRHAMFKAACGETRKCNIYRTIGRPLSQRASAPARGHRRGTSCPRTATTLADETGLQTEPAIASHCNWLKPFLRSDCTSSRPFRSVCQSWVIKTAQNSDKIYSSWLVAERSVTTRRLVCEDPKNVCTRYATGRQCPNEEGTSHFHKTHYRQVDISHGDHL